MPVIVITISLIITGVVMWFIEPNLLGGLGIGLVLGLTLATAIIRMLGVKSPSSLVISEAFYKLTGYKATIYNIPIQQPPVVQAAVYGNGHDYADLMDVLKRQMKFPAAVAKEAAKYAIDTTKDQPLQEKIRVALQYVGGAIKKS